MMRSEAIYSDKLVTITPSHMIFHHYYFPTGKDKVVEFDSIEAVRIEKPTLWSGKWRLQGTGDFRIWFPMDVGRPKRDRIFIATLKNQWVKIGFTVEDGDRVEALLHSKNLMSKGDRS